MPKNKKIKKPVPSDALVASIREGRKIAKDSTVKGCKNIEELKDALE